MPAINTDALVASLCRSNPAEARQLALRLPDAARAQLALFCYARMHLRQIGLAIADVCSEASLFDEGGIAGRSLFRHAAIAIAPPTRRITLATRVEPMAA